MLPPFPLLSSNSSSNSSSNNNNNNNKSSIARSTNTNTINQLSEFVVHMVPKIWNGTSFTYNNNRKRYHSFKLFCQRLLKATQISVSCILISLFYIHKLRFAYPKIKGSMGSEIRLFTTALVLANKFLDDNTFTNKAWSQISSIPIRELNIMEIEFLSALNYKIYISPNQFYSWTIQCQQWIPQRDRVKRRIIRKRVSTTTGRNEPFQKPIVIIQHDFNKSNRIISFRG